MNTDDELLLQDGLLRLLNTITMMCEPDCDWDYIKNETTIAARDIRLVLDKTKVSLGMDLGSPDGDETKVMAVECDGEKFKVTQLLDDNVFDTFLDMESE